MVLASPADVAVVAFTAWLALTIGSYLAIRVYLSRRGEPEGWRFNQVGSLWFPGHLSFYPREGNDRREGVVFRAVSLFPLFWTVRVGRSRSDLETVRRGPIWTVIPWAFGWMSERGGHDS